MSSPFPTISSPLKARCEGEFVRRLKKVPELRKNFPRINPQYVNEAAIAPKITVVAQVGPQYTVQSSIYRIQMTISAELPDPPSETGIDNAKLLDSAGGLIQSMLEAAQAEGAFGVIPGTWYERRTENTRARVFGFQIISA